MSSFQVLPNQINFSEQERLTLEQWKTDRVFETSLEQSKGKPLFRFYDGPPFGTGKPHYGHILAGTIKDAVTRYAHQTGHHVPRRFGWDTHGLPVEQIVDKKLGVQTRADVEAFGIYSYNAVCKSVVLQCAQDWRETVARMGRFIDFDGAYQTMSPTYMESVWWAFSELHKKGLIYCGYKVMPYSIGCSTTLSNFEAGQDFRDVSDPSIIVPFPLCEPEANNEIVYLLAWTTTAWTLPANLALGVHPDLAYVKVRDTSTQRIYMLAETRLAELYKGAKPGQPHADYCLVGEKTHGRDLVGKRYHHPLSKTDDDILSQFPASLVVIAAPFVSEATGTGVVHLAPGHGEDDYEACISSGLVKRDQIVPGAVDDQGLFSSDAPEGFAGRHYKDSEKDWIKMLKQRGLVIKQTQIVHRVAFCWRSGVPLIHRAQPSWFVRVSQLKERLMQLSDTTTWQPDFVKSKRFHNWLAEARDWAISRTRFWGTPLPIWTNGHEMVVIGSVDDLRARAINLTTTEIDSLGEDLHLDKLRHVKLRASELGQPDLQLDGTVFDCWFESACAPFASQHYPFENQTEFDSHPVADFVAEGLDQTRGWFYTMLVMSTALFDRAPFRNVIVNGLVLADDGIKMSKLRQNYPDPTEILDAYGADALRAYLLSSPAVHAEPLRFQKHAVQDVHKSLLLPWFNVLRYLVENAQRYERAGGGKFFDMEPQIRTIEMDIWLMAQCVSMEVRVREHMAQYRLAPIVPLLVDFIEDMRTTYIALNRERLKGATGQSQTDTLSGLQTLYIVLRRLAVVAAPFLPFFSEFSFQVLWGSNEGGFPRSSVHLEMIPHQQVSSCDLPVQHSMGLLKQVLHLGRLAREKRHLTMKLPVQEVVVVHSNPAVVLDLQRHTKSLTEGLRCRRVTFSSSTQDWMSLRAEPNRRTIGQRFGNKSKFVVDAIAALDQTKLMQLKEQGSYELDSAAQVGPFLLTTEFVDINIDFRGDTTQWQEASNGSFLVLVNAVTTPELAAEYHIREIVRQAQQLRKTSRLKPTDTVHVWLVPEHNAWQEDVEIALLHDHPNVFLQLLGQTLTVATPQETRDATLQSLIIATAPLVLSKNAWSLYLVADRT